MMNENDIELARRAVACKGWSFAVGVVVEDGDAVDWVVLPSCWVARACGNDAKIQVFANICSKGFPLPLLYRASTLGCLEVMVSRACGGVPVWVVARTHRCDEDTPAEWVAYRANGYFLPVCIGRGETKAHALVAALEGA